ncbi:hypothetical protein JG687_00013618 [Phytophthora cactorum]|uniref:Uncharacterized protein n=1 Tax=Phytophthora cactorum TaxID=29920 RepID=A0A8T1TYV4_9STRA|nr:hypothetical protein JG687_00013618 [Phytophthora cactorum]
MQLLMPSSPTHGLMITSTHIKAKEKYIEQADVCELAADAVDDWDCAVGDADEGNDMGHQRSEINDEE